MIEQLKAAYDAATPEEWRLEDGTEPGGHKLIVDVQDVSIARCYQQPYDTWKASDNAAFIALAHNLTPTLLEAVNALNTLTGMAESFASELFDKHPDVIRCREILTKLQGT